MPLVIPDRTNEHNIPGIPWWHSCEAKSGHDLQSQQYPSPLCAVFDKQDMGHI